MSWEKNILITGGAGFIGSHLVRLMVNKYPTYRIVCLDKLTYAGNLKNITDVESAANYVFVKADIVDAEAMKRVFAEYEITDVIHLAAESHVDRSIEGPMEFVMTNVVGTVNLLQVAKDYWTGDNHVFHHVSTDEVYGSIEEGSWDEAQPLLPNSPYSASKASSDLLVRSYHVTHGLNTSITRCSNNYGTHHFPEKLIPLFVTNLLDGHKVPLYGDGQNIRDWLHVDDHCRGIALVLTQGRAGEIYNIGGGTELSNAELTKALLEATSRDDSFIQPVADRLGHDRRYSVDIQKISSELGYAPKVPFEEGLADVVQWYRDNRWWWEPLKERSGL